MLEKTLHVAGMGIVTDDCLDVRQLARTLNAPDHKTAFLARAKILDPATVESHDQLAQLAIRALHQAWTMAGMTGTNPHRVALIFASAWGMIDSTAAFLESMLDAEGRHASPRFFSRSVYSSGASAIAIHFGIQGPCETLAFDEDAARGRGAVAGALAQAWRFLATGRCDRVAIVWADQSCELATDLVGRASEKLKRRDFDRYVRDGLGQGAVALIAAPSEIASEISLPLPPFFTQIPPSEGKPFPMDAAVSLLETLLRRSSVLKSQLTL